MSHVRRILITGSQGFIGKNLVARLGQQATWHILEFNRGDAFEILIDYIAQADAVVHLAGVNRSAVSSEFMRVNMGLTEGLCDVIRTSKRKTTTLLASSIHSKFNSPYGQSKRSAERAIVRMASVTDNPVIIYRLPGVFGRWCRPNYNSVVATFCHNIANDLPIHIDEPAARIRLVHIDDVVSGFIRSLSKTDGGVWWARVIPEYEISLADLADQIRAFRYGVTHPLSESVAPDLARALYRTYASYLSPNRSPCNANS